MFDQNVKMPAIHEWTFNVQRELPGGLSRRQDTSGSADCGCFDPTIINQIDAGPILPSFRIRQQNVAAGCLPDGSGCAGGKPVPLVTSGIMNSAFVNQSVIVTDLAPTQNAAGDVAARIEQPTLAARRRPNQ